MKPESAARLQIGAQRREPRGGLRAGGGVVEGLELGLKHLTRNLVTARKPGNAWCRMQAIDHELCDAE